MELEQIGRLVHRYIRERLGESGHLERLCQLADIRRQHYYWQGKQYLRPQYQALSVVGYQPVSANELAADGRGAYADVYNIFRGDGTKLISVLANRAPNVEAAALIPTDESSQQLAKAVTRVIQALRNYWDCDEIQQDLAYLAWVSGTFFIRVEMRESPEHGYTESVVQSGSSRVAVRLDRCLSCGMEADGLADLPNCPCGSVAVQAGEPREMEIPQFESRRQVNAMPELEALDAASIVIPSYARDIDKAPFVIQEDEYFKGDLMAMFPHLKDGSNAGESLDNQGGLFTRQSLTGQPSATQAAHLWTMSQVWITPAAYSQLREDGALAQKFPSGAKLIFVRGVLVHIEEGRASHWITAGKPSVSRTIHCQSLGYDFLPSQDAFNGQMNILTEILERNLPITLVNEAMLSADAMRQRMGFAGEFVPVLPTGSHKLADAVYNVQQPRIEPAAMNWAENVHSVGRENAGILPALFGGSTEHQITALEADNRLQQALAQLNIVWNGMRRVWRGAYTNALRALVTYGSGALESLGVSREDVRLLEQAFDQHGRLLRVAIHVQESIPATPAQIRSALQTAIQGGPPVWGMLQLDRPENAGSVRQGLGLSGFQNSGEREQAFVLMRIREIVDGAPADLEPDEISFLPPQSAIDLARSWALGEDGLRARQENPQGYLEVAKWITQWQELMAPLPLPPGQHPGGGGSPPSAPAAGLPAENTTGVENDLGV